MTVAASSPAATVASTSRPGQMAATAGDLGVRHSSAASGHKGALRDLFGVAKSYSQSCLPEQAACYAEAARACLSSSANVSSSCSGE
jgi:hypothetical protein